MTKNSSVENLALIVAGGIGSRMNVATPKQYLKCSNITILENTVKIFTACSKIDKIIIITAPNDSYIDQIKFGEKVAIAKVGGSTRQKSVFNGLAVAKNYNPLNILIHDAVRPFLSSNLLNSIIDHLVSSQEEAVIPVIKINQALKKCHDHYIIANGKRENYMLAQTPQAFKFQSLYQAYENCNEEFDDDAAVAFNNNMRVKTIMGENQNIKITQLEDLKFLANEYRIGNGFDVHQFKDGEHITLGGIKIPFNKAILAHSDGDVLLHALVDAMLGAIGEGDIGVHFPPTDPKWKDCDSTHFLKHAHQLLINHHAKIVNIDLTLISEAPRIKNYRASIVENIAHLLDIQLSRVSLKATTTEKLGFLGREEGIAAMATISIAVTVLE